MDNKNQLPEKNDKPDKINHLKASIGYFIAWIAVAYNLINEFKENGGTEYIFSSMYDGYYYPVLLAVACIVLLALSMSNLAYYLKPDIKRTNNH